MGMSGRTRSNVYCPRKIHFTGVIIRNEVVETGIHKIRDTITSDIITSEARQTKNNENFIIVYVTIKRCSYFLLVIFQFPKYSRQDSEYSG